MRQVPILLLSDNPALNTGLARITRDLASLLSRSPKFRVGTMGMVGLTSRHLPFAQYTFPQDGAWGSQHLQSIWQDFAGRERGIVFTIWDATRTHWLAQPRYCGNAALQQFLSEGHFSLWGYFPIDATGPNDRLSGLATDSLLGYNRILTYTQWAEGIVRNSLGDEESRRRGLNWLPHGIDFNQWVIRDREEAKRRFYPLVHDGDQLVGVVGTNQPRKDWGLIADITRRMIHKNPRVRFWWHVDLLERHWSIPALLADFGLQQHVTVTTHMTNDDLCWAYNACDLVMLPSLGEGFGYPLAESLACGTPVLHGDYAGGADWLRQAGEYALLIEPKCFRYDGLHNQIRPVFDAQAWADRAYTLLCIAESVQASDREHSRASVVHLSWANLWESCWLRWLEEGL